MELVPPVIVLPVDMFRVRAVPKLNLSPHPLEGTNFFSSVAPYFEN